jgi:hypothetical protein
MFTQNVFRRNSLFISLLFLIASIFYCSGRGDSSVTILFDASVPTVEFAAGDIRDALTENGFDVAVSDISLLSGADGDIRIVLASGADGSTASVMTEGGAALPGDLVSEGYRLRKTTASGQTTYWVIGADDAGTMYGGFELAEIIWTRGLDAVGPVDHNPYMAMRGTKFNIPLDARSPSYSDPSDAAQKNIIEMWNFDFWKEYIDTMARNRYNFISLWSLHLFPSMVKVPDYPDIALDDVMRSTVEWEENNSLSGSGFDSPEILGSLETLKEITIDEKIEYWRKVMRYAKDRNIDFYVVTWNIFTNGTYGQYGITDKIDNPVTTDYFRKSVTQMFLTYPDLAGIGLTTGENMQKATFAEKEQWAFETYGRGILDAAELQPDREFVFLHRQHQTGAQDIARQFEPLITSENIEFIFSFKYAKAHVYSSTTQHFADDFVKDIGDLKTIWTLRNDDVYHFRWGAPDFVREFIQNIPYEVSRGFYLGSDQYIWGREFMSTEPETLRQIEVVKHWYHWMIWGRLGYDPEVSNERFTDIIRRRLPNAPAELLFKAWQEASMIYPTTTGFHWGSLDFQWYIEACKSQPGPAQTESGFHDVNRFITLRPHKDTDNISIPDYVNGTMSGTALSGTTPIEVSVKLHRHADVALGIIEGISDGGNKELRLTLGDIRAMAYLGKYYGYKIRGATELALYRATGKQEHQQNAVSELTDAADYWKQYTAQAMKQYTNPLWTNRVGYVDFKKLTGYVMEDIDIAKAAVKLID